MKTILRLVGWIWGIVFMAFVAATLYQGSGRQLPEQLAQYRDAVQSGLDAFLTSWVFVAVFIAGWFGTTYLLGRQSGWQQLAERYRDNGVTAGSELQLSTGSGRVGKISYSGALRVGGHRSGLALRVFFLFRFGSPNLLVPWQEIQRIAVKKTAVPKESENFMHRLQSSLSRQPHAHVSLARFPGQVLVLPWNEKLRAALPESVELEQ